MSEDNTRRKYEPPVLKPVDLVKAGKPSRLAAVTPGYVLAQAPTSTSNVSGGVVISAAPFPAGEPPKR